MDPALAAHLRPGSIVQLDPERAGNRAFGGCLLVVVEVKSWGVVGYVQALGEARDQLGGQAYYRASWNEFEPCDGRCVWGPAPEEEP